MKTETVSNSGVLFTQAKPMKENKTADKRNTEEAIEDKVDLSTTGPSVAFTPILSYRAAQDLIKGIDFNQAIDATRISKEATSQLMELLQS